MKNCIRKIAVFFTAAILVTVFSGCQQDAGHEHTFAATWTSDATNHWHAATCEHTDQVSGKTAHTFGDWDSTTGMRKCTVCGYEEACAHNWNEGVVTTAATETAEGTKTYTCTVCGGTKTESINKLDHVHKFAEAWTSDATNHWHASTCGHTDQVSGKTAHTFGDWNSTTGMRKCTVCGYEEACAHNWNEGVVTTAATETAEGTKTYTCTVCGGTKTESINKLDHVHKFAEAWTSDATNHWHASTCGHTDQVSGKTAHTFGDWNSTTGKRSCTVCGYEEACAHTWNGGAVTTAATCTEKGVKTYTCTVCGKTKTEEIAATGHSFADTWTSDETNHWHAATCEHIDQVSAKAAHTEDNGTVTTAPACLTTGTKTYKCSVCEKILRTEEIAALGHKWNGTLNNSTISFVCSACGATKTETKNFYETCTDATTGNAATSSSTYVYFGVFPKTVAYKDDSGKLYAADKTTEITIDENTSVTMGGNTYYKGSDGEYYAKVTENGYNSSYTYLDGTKVNQSSANSTRYFKVEPIKWKVLTTNYNSTGKALLLAEDILTANIPYYNLNSSSNTYSANIRTVDGVSGIYPNNYKYSQIRAYLNGLDYYYDTSSTETTKVETYTSKGFLQTAFTTAAQSLIETTTVDNSAASTTDAGGNITQASSYTCADTQDKIFLLSEQEVTTTDYGFASYDSYGTGNARIRVTTDYAKANYAFQCSIDGEGGFWWLRSPLYDYSDSACGVNLNGDASCWDFVFETVFGVVPALTISLQ